MYLRKVCSMLTMVLFVAGLWCYCFGAPWALTHIERETRHLLEAEGNQMENIDILEAYYDRTSQYKYFSRVKLQDQEETWVYCYDLTGNLQRIE